jgi:transcriptional regulator with XRE-family HTH domain
MEETSVLITKLKAKMFEKRISPGVLASLAGVGKSFVYDVLSGKSKYPTLIRLEKIAKVLDIPLYELVGGDENITKQNVCKNYETIFNEFKLSFVSCLGHELFSDRMAAFKELCELMRKKLDKYEENNE